MTETYPFILKEIINKERNDYNRKEILDVFYKETNDVKGIKKILPTADSLIKWKLMDKLIESNEIKFIESFLLRTRKNNINPEDKINIIEYLIKIQNIEGLKSYIELVYEANEKNLNDLHYVQSLTMLSKREAITYLMELLDISYKKEIKFDRRLDTLNSIVLGALFNIAMINEKNLDEVKKNLEKFMNKNIKKYKNVNFLLHTIENMEIQFYMNKAQTYKIEDVIEKLKIK